MLYCWLDTVQTKQRERNSGRSRTAGVLDGASKATSALGEVLTSVMLRALLLNQILFSSSGNNFFHLAFLLTICQ